MIKIKNHANEQSFPVEKDTNDKIDLAISWQVSGEPRTKSYDKPPIKKAE